MKKQHSSIKDIDQYYEVNNEFTYRKEKYMIKTIFQIHEKRIQKNSAKIVCIVDFIHYKFPSIPADLFYDNCIPIPSPEENTDQNQYQLTKSIKNKWQYNKDVPSGLYKIKSNLTGRLKNSILITKNIDGCWNCIVNKKEFFDNAVIATKTIIENFSMIGKMYILKKETSYFKSDIQIPTDENLFKLEKERVIRIEGVNSFRIYNNKKEWSKNIYKTNIAIDEYAVPYNWGDATSTNTNRSGKTYKVISAITVKRNNMGGFLTETQLVPNELIKYKNNETFNIINRLPKCTFKHSQELERFIKPYTVSTSKDLEHLDRDSTKKSYEVYEILKTFTSQGIKFRRKEYIFFIDQEHFKCATKIYGSGATYQYVPYSDDATFTIPYHEISIKVTGESISNYNDIIDQSDIGESYKVDINKCNIANIQQDCESIKINKELPKKMQNPAWYY